jgi:hypothetical protein
MQRKPSATKRMTTVLCTVIVGLERIVSLMNSDRRIYTSAQEDRSCLRRVETGSRRAPCFDDAVKWRQRPTIPAIRFPVGTLPLRRVESPQPSFLYHFCGDCFRLRLDRMEKWELRWQNA